MSIEQHAECKQPSRSAPFSGVLAPGVGLVPFVLATPHPAAMEVVEQIDQATVSTLATAYCGATPALGTTAENATHSRVGSPKVPPYM